MHHRESKTCSGFDDIAGHEGSPDGLCSLIAELRKNAKQR